MPVPAKRQGNFLMAMVVMLIGPLLLVWLPGIGSFLSGLLGGHLAGSAKSGVLAAILPIIFVAVALFLLSLHSGPIGGIVGAVGVVIFSIFLIINSIAVVIGAAIGGALL